VREEEEEEEEAEEVIRFRLFTAAAASAVAFLFAGAAQAATITVNSTSDAVAADTNCTLREAITAANANAAANGCTAGDAGSLDTIVLGSVTYSRTLAPNASNDDNAGGDLDVDTAAGPLEIRGAGPSATTISGNSSDRVLDLHGGGQVTLQDLRVSGSTITASSGNPARGAGIRAAGGPGLTLVNVSVASNTATGTAAEVTGGGIFQSGGTLALNNASIASNSVTSTSGASGNGLIAGGGLYLDGVALIADRAHLISNNAGANFTLTAPGVGLIGGAGAAISGGSASLTRTVVQNNSLSHSNTTQDANAAQRGGGLWFRNDAAGTVNESLFLVNQAGTSNATQSVGGAAIAVDGAAAPVTITNSTFSQNSMSGGVSRAGAAIYWNDGVGANDTLRIDNSTFSSNSGQTAGSQGGAIWATDGNIRVANITTGATTGGSTGANVAAEGRSIWYSAGDGTFEIRGSVLAEGTTAPGECGGPNKPTSLGYNVEQGPLDDCLFAATGDTLGDPGLANIADNGTTVIAGATFNSPAAVQTRMPGSLAIDRIPTAACLDSAGAPLARDQRGVARNAGNCDSGAVEADCAGRALTQAGTSGPDALTGTSGDDVIAGLDGDDVIDGGGGDDTICGGGGADTLNGQDDDDTLLGGPGTGAANNDVLDGGPGTDTDSAVDSTGIVANLSDAAAGATPAHTSTGPGTDTLAGIENVVGSPFADTITGDDGPNVLDGGPGVGQSTLDGRGGDDTLIGSANGTSDAVTYANFAAAITADMSAGTVTGQGTDTLNGIESITGSPLDDSFIPVISTASNSVNGSGGSDSITYAAIPASPDGSNGITATMGSSATGPLIGTDGLSATENIVGTPNNDTLTGNGGVLNTANRLEGGAGRDVINGQDGDDQVIGGEGPDTAAFNTVNAAVTADLDAGTATGQGSDSLLEIENLTGSAQSDTLAGDEGDNVLDGRALDDSLDGNGGSDTAAYSGIATAVTADLGAGTSTGQGTDALAEIENLLGSTQLDTLTGDAFANVLEGNNGNDNLNGSGGLDTAAYTTSTAAITASIAAQTATGQGTDTYTGIEGVLGSAFSDSLTGDANDNRLDGAGGVDTVTFAAAAGAVSANLATDSASGDGGDALPNVENLIGSPQDDLLTGDAASNVLDGAAGNDTASFAGATAAITASLRSDSASGEGSDSLPGIENLTGGDGDDILSGDESANVLDGGPGSDRVSYAPATGGVQVDLSADTATGEGADSLPAIEDVTGSEHADTVAGDSADNDLSGGGGIDRVSFAAATAGVTADLTAGTAGGDGADTLQEFENLAGSPQDDELSGNAEDNVLSGGAGDDALDGRDGRDRADFGGASTAVTASLADGTATGEGSDTLTAMEDLAGGEHADTLEGDGGSNTLDGGGGTDTATFESAGAAVDASLRTGTASGDGTDELAAIENLTGSAHDDVLAGDEGDNTLAGGEGFDTAAFDGAGSGVNADLRAGTATGDGSDSLSAIEALRGSSQDDTLAGDGVANVLDGAGGSDTADYSASPAAITVDLSTDSSSGDGADSLPAIENVVATALDDILGGDAAANRLAAGGGNDTVTFASSAGNVDASLASGIATGDGTDELEAVENLIGSPRADTLTGDGGANALTGAAGSDLLAGGGGADALSAGEGANRVHGDGGDDVITAGAGPDRLVGGADADSVEGGAGNDQLAGDDGDDLLAGGAGSDQALGGAGADELLLRDSTADAGDCGADSVADRVEADAYTLDLLTNCTSTDSLDFSGGPPPAGEQPPAAEPPAKKTCPKNKRLKKGKCVKKKRKKKKTKGKRALR
jgi:CSLREA domain-containing protein